MTNELDAYRLYYHSAPQYSWQSRLYLYNDGKCVGYIYFIKNENNIPANVVIGVRPKIHFPASKFEEIMNILRYEQPL